VDTMTALSASSTSHRSLPKHVFCYTELRRGKSPPRSRHCTPVDVSAPTARPHLPPFGLTLPPLRGAPPPVTPPAGGPRAPQTPRLRIQAWTPPIPRAIPCIDACPLSPRAAPYAGVRPLCRGQSPTPGAVPAPTVSGHAATPAPHASLVLAPIAWVAGAMRSAP
jgi:hypothetical protein